VGFWNQKLDFIARDSAQFMIWDFRILLTFDNALPDDSTFKSFGLELIILVNLGGFPIHCWVMKKIIFLPPPPENSNRNC
jgi:hypothetical protein